MSNTADRTVTVHLLVTATSEAETLAKAMSAVVPSIYATGDSVDLGQHRGMSTGSSGVWQPDLELSLPRPAAESNPSRIAKSPEDRDSSSSRWTIDYRRRYSPTPDRVDEIRDSLSPPPS